MLKTYKESVDFTLDGELVKGYYRIVIREEDEAISKEEEWQGLENIKHVVITDFNDTIFYGYSWLRKQFGLMGCDCIFLRVKKNSTLKRVIKYKEVDLSINEMFSLSDTKRVIEYMKQQGITICPMKA